MTQSQPQQSAGNGLSSSTRRSFSWQNFSQVIYRNREPPRANLDTEYQERLRAAKERAMERRKSSGNTTQKGANFFDEGQNDDYSSYFSQKKQSGNPFDDDDAEDDTKKAPTANARLSRSSTLPHGASGEEKLLSPQELYQQEMLRIQDRTLQSTQKSMGLIHESEAVGTAAAQELLSQREQLENTNRTLDEMNSTLDQSQRHINNIKSIFGGIKNWWTSKAAESAAPVPVARSDKLKSFLDPDAANKNPSLPSGSVSSIPSSKGFAEERPRAPSQTATLPSSSRDFDRALDGSLDQMSLGLSRLKGLAEGLGDEINSQNRLLDDMNTKTEKVDVKMGVQQNSLDRILGKKK